MARDFMPGLEEEEKEQDQIYEQRNKRILIDLTSEKTNGKGPAGLTDSSADKEFDEEPHRKTLKLLASHPRSSSTLSPALYMESPEKPINLKLKHSLPSPTVNPGSNLGYPYRPKEFSHFESGSVADSWFTGVNAFTEDSLGDLDYEPFPYARGDFEPSWRTAGTFEPFFGAERAFTEMPQLPGNIGTLLNSCVEKYQAEHETAKKFNFSTKRKRNLRWTNIEDMLLSVTNLPQMQMEAVRALYRQERKTREQTTGRIFSDSQYAKLKRIVEFLTAGYIHGPCIKTSEELEETYRGCTAYCSWLVCTFSSELYRIYRGGLDLYFN